jgi:hypothetical protein
MNRFRSALISLAGPLWLVTAPFSVLPMKAQPATPFSAGSTMEQAFTYAFPVAEMMRLRWSYLEEPANPARGTANQIVHGRDLTDYRRRVVTTPNNDTLYSRAVLDLSTGPVRIHVPDTNGRYYSLAFYDIFSNHFATIGRRVTGTREGDFIVVGPWWQGELPESPRLIRAPSDDVLVLARIVVDGPADLAQVHALQDGIQIAALNQRKSQRPKGIAPVPGNAAAFVASVNQALALNEVPSYETPLLERFASVGICGKKCSWDALPGDVRAEWDRRFPAMLASLKKPIAGDGKPVDGWNHNPPQIGNFGTDYNYRAVVALNALLAMEPAEAVYPSTETDTRGDSLTGERKYRLHIPASGVPVEAFWSLSMYELMVDGRRFFSANPINRYAIGDRTRGLKKNADGSIDILVQHDAPGGDGDANWLPAPRGPFSMVLRAYQPKSDILDDRFRIPGVERVE